MGTSTHYARMTSFTLTGDALWERMDRAVEKVRQRLELTARTLESAGIPHAIVGGNAVRAWVAQVDEAAVRTTRDVDILIRRSDLPAAIDLCIRKEAPILAMARAPGFTVEKLKAAWAEADDIH